jgi:hypothetical protein
MPGCTSPCAWQPRCATTRGPRNAGRLARLPPGDDRAATSRRRHPGCRHRPHPTGRRCCSGVRFMERNHRLDLAGQQVKTQLDPSATPAWCRRVAAGPTTSPSPVWQSAPSRCTRPPTPSAWRRRSTKLAPRPNDRRRSRPAAAPGDRSHRWGRRHRGGPGRDAAEAGPRQSPSPTARS